MRRVLLLVPTTTYRVGAFLDAAHRLGVELVVGSDRRQVFEHAVPGLMLTLDFQDRVRAVSDIERFAKVRPLDAIIGADDETVLVAAEAASTLGLRGNPPVAVATTRSKILMRWTLDEAGIPTPRHRIVDVEEDAHAAARQVRFPCVLKPTFLSASRGVIRADDADQFVSAHGRIAALLSDPNLKKYGGEEARRLLVEEYVPGKEYALEGVICAGRPRVLAVFDKPDPLEGPYFEETIYVTPSRAPEATRKQMAGTFERVVRALGLTEGAVHAELRVNTEGAFLIDIAARAIGGRCSGVLCFEGGVSLEEVLLRQALGEKVSDLELEPGGAGVMMIPIPRSGVLRNLEGLEEARAVEGVTSVDITLGRGQEVRALPEGYQYLGFILARAATAEAVEAALRKAHRCLEIEIDSG